MDRVETTDSFPNLSQLEAELEREKYKGKYRQTFRSTIAVLIVTAAVVVLLAFLIFPVFLIRIGFCGCFIVLFLTFQRKFVFGTVDQTLDVASVQPDDEGGDHDRDQNVRAARNLQKHIDLVQCVRINEHTHY